MRQANSRARGDGASNSLNWCCSVGVSAAQMASRSAYPFWQTSANTFLMSITVCRPLLPMATRIKPRHSACVSGSVWAGAGAGDQTATKLFDISNHLRLLKLLYILLIQVGGVA